MGDSEAEKLEKYLAEKPSKRKKRSRKRNRFRLMMIVC